MNILGQPEMPLGLGMALMMNPKALDYYSKLPNEQKRAVIDNTHSITNKADMQAYVESLAMKQ